LKGLELGSHCVDAKATATDAAPGQKEIHCWVTEGEDAGGRDSVVSAQIAMADSLTVPCSHAIMLGRIADLAAGQEPRCGLLDFDTAQVRTRIPVVEMKYRDEMVVMVCSGFRQMYSLSTSSTSINCQNRICTPMSTAFY
jgi:hypothetical protein